MIYLSAAGLLFDILGFIILFYNGNFSRNFNRLDGFEIHAGGADGKGGGMKAIEKPDVWPRVFDYLGFSSIIVGFVLQFLGLILGSWVVV